MTRAHLLYAVLVAVFAVGSGHTEPLFPYSSYPTGSVPVDVDVSDFNNDGLQDLAVANYGSNDVSVFLGDGQGSFRFSTTVPVGSGPVAIMAWGDSLIVANSLSNDISVLIGHGDGVTFTSRRFPVGRRPVALATSDIVEDGYVDLLVLNHDSGDVTVLSRLASMLGGAPPAAVYRIPVGYGARSIAIDRIDGRFSPDIAVAGDFGVRVLLNQGAPDAWDIRDVPGVGSASSVIIWEYGLDGILDLGVGADDGIFVLPGVGDGSFGAAQKVADGPIRQLTFEHFNDTGLWDLMAVNDRGCCSEGSMTFVPVFEHSRFGEPVVFAQGAAPYRMAVGDAILGDVNADLKRDLVVTVPGSNSVAVLLGNGDGTFVGDTHIPAGSSMLVPRPVVADDFDGDGRTDLALGDVDFVEVHPGRGDGQFEPPALTPLSAPVGSRVTALASDDFDGDGVRDLVVASGTYEPGSARVTALLGAGDGSFKSAAILPSPGVYSVLASGDFDGNGRRDVAVADPTFSYVAIFLGAGDGSFGAPINVITNHSTSAIVGCDVDENGIDDLVMTAGESSGAVFIVLARGSGVFVPGPTYLVGAFPAGVACADLDGDGHVDLAAADWLSSEVAVLRGAGDGTFGPPQFFPTGDRPRDIRAGDLDGDGRLDLATVHDPGFVSYLLGRGDGTFAPPARSVERDTSRRLAIADFNGDGRPDFVLGVADGAAVLLNQPPPDADHDGIPDRIDTCTDTDGDGFGDPLFPANTCPEDNCPTNYNPGQEDGDGDFIGDVCDACPTDYWNDLDGDGLCTPEDNCPTVYNPAQEPGPDRDGDGKLDECDNCPDTPNPDQADRNHDFWGDACQPDLRILDVIEDGGDELEVDVVARDPQGDALSGNIAFYARDNIFLTPAGPGGPSCDDAAFPGFRHGEGLAYAVSEDGTGVLYDLDSRLHCNDGVQDYEIAFGLQQGACTDASTVWSSSLVVTNTDHQLMCIRRVGDPRSQFELVFGGSPEGFGGQYFSTLSVDFAGGLPTRVDISPLIAGIRYDLVINATDGTTGPVYADVLFLDQGEKVMVLRQSSNGPTAIISAPASVECVSVGHGPVTLDGSGSTPGDPTAPITGYEWFLNFGQPGQVSLGTGPVLQTVLPLGENPVTLRVTDAKGAAGTAMAVTRVVDTRPPVLELAADPGVLWPPNHRMVPVHIGIQVADACDPAPVVGLISAVSSEPDDAPDGADGNTTGDVSDATLGTSDDTVLLRSERSGNGPGRLYTLTYSVHDASGQSSSAIVAITVPHDLGSGPEPLLLSVETSALGMPAHVYWPAVPEALFYDVISGRVDEIRRLSDRISLGTVRVVAIGLTGTSVIVDATAPELGHAFFYVVQSHGPKGASGYGTESAALPSQPGSCEGGCPGESLTGSSTNDMHKK